MKGTWLVSSFVFVLLVGVAAAEAQGQSCVQPPSSLTSWWPGDGDAQDIAGVDHGTLANGAGFSTGFVTSGTGEAFSLDGVDDFVEIQDSPSLRPQHFTLDAWVYLRPDTSNYWHCIICKQYGFGVYMSYGLFVEGGKLAVVVSTQNVINRRLTGSSLLPEGMFFHAATTWDGTELRLYLDGSLVASWSDSTQFPVIYDENPVLLGADDHGSNSFVAYLDGMIDEAEVFNRALSADEILHIYNAGAAGKCRAAILACTGFQPPMASGPVTAKGPRALPLKAQLFDADGYEMTDLELAAPPVLQVIFTPAGGGAAVDVTDDALPVGFGTEGNQFEYNLVDHVWQYNLKTRDYTAAGNYTITMVPGDDSEYLIDPTCEAVFDRPE